jgi:hypothetical protein
MYSHRAATTPDARQQDMMWSSNSAQNNTAMNGHAFAPAQQQQSGAYGDRPSKHAQMGFGNQGSYYNAQQILSQQGGGGAANAMHHQHDRIGSAQGHRAGGMSGGAPHLLPNQLAASLNNPGMPGATSPNPAPEMLLSQFQSKGANMTHNVFSPQSHPSLPQGGHPSHHQGQQGAQQQAQQAGQTGRLLLLPSGQAPPPNSDEAKIYVLIAELLDPQTRETALLELSKKREMYEDLALVLWGGFGRCRFTFTQAMLASFD